MKYAAYLASALVAATAAFAQPAPDRPAAPARPAAVDRPAATEKDYRATLGRVGVREIRAASAETAALPPLLTDAAGRAIDSRGAWERRRRELAALLDSEIYGQVPATAPAIRWEFVHQEYRRIGGVRAVSRRYLGRAANFGLESPDFAIELVIDIPEAGRGRLPMILEIGPAELARSAGGAAREQVLGRGWGYAVLVAPTVQADDGAGLREGVIGFAAQGRPRGNGDWGARRAWAWGAGRALDLFLLDPRIDRRRIAVAGTGRFGTAALLALAHDERFSLGFAGASGPGGALPLRRATGAPLAALAAADGYHGFAPNLLRYAGGRPFAELPVDAHTLIAMAAPRALFLGESEDARESADAASPVWRLYGLDGRIELSRQDGGGTDQHWPAFLAFAERIWGSDGRR